MTQIREIASWYQWGVKTGQSSHREIQDGTGAEVEVHVEDFSDYSEGAVLRIIILGIV